MKKIMIIIAVILATGQFAAAQDKDTVTIVVPYQGKGDTYAVGTRDGAEVVIRYKERKKPTKKKASTTTLTGAAKYERDSIRLEEMVQRILSAKETTTSAAGTLNHFESGVTNPVTIQNTGSGIMYVTFNNGASSDTAMQKRILADTATGATLDHYLISDQSVIYSKRFKKAMRHCPRLDESAIADMKFTFKEFDPESRYKERRRRVLFDKVCKFGVGMIKTKQLLADNDSSILSTKVPNALNTTAGMIQVVRKGSKWYVDFHAGVFGSESEIPGQKVRVIYSKRKKGSS